MNNLSKWVFYSNFNGYKPHADLYISHFAFLRLCVRFKSLLLANFYEKLKLVETQNFASPQTTQTYLNTHL